MSGPTTPGPVYDNALRHLGHAELRDLLTYLGLDPAPESAQLSAALPATTLHADLIADLGSGRLVHLEFGRQDLQATTLVQHVLVLAEGTVSNPFAGPAPDSQFTLDLEVTYLRDHDPVRLLSGPALAPLAVLARADSARARQATFRQALTVIADVPDRSRRHALARIAATLDEDTVAGRAIATAAEARGEARGRTATLAGLLRRTFGDDPRVDAIARHLATLPEDQALDRALTALTLDDLTPPT